MLKTKPKIWNEWKEVNKSRYELPEIFDIGMASGLGWCIVKCSDVKDGKYWYLTPFKTFKTKEAAMLKAQSLILKEFKKIQKVIKDKV